MSNTELLTTDRAAQMLGVSTSFLNKARLTGDGPPFVKIGARIVYDPADLAAWIEARKHRSTSEYPAVIL
jgi:predicted DNA-binding transcriptional regulator AlpA